MICPYKVRWRNQSSLDFNLTTELSFDSDQGEVETYLGRNAVASESYNGTFKRVYGYSWDQTLSPTITFIKPNRGEFTFEENRKILAWLTSGKNASYLDVYRSNSDKIDYCILGNFITVNQYKLTNGRIIGYTATFESVAPWAFSEIIDHSWTLAADQTVSIDIQTDELDALIYPKIFLTSKSKIDSITIGNWYMVDANDSYVSTTIKNISSNELIIIDGANKVISSDKTVDRVFGDDFDFNWLPLAYGENSICTNKGCTLTFQYRVPIKCGEF